MSPISNMNNTVDNSKSLAIDTIRLLSKGAFKISDILTYPIHQIIDHPGRKIQKSKSIKGVRLNNEDIYSPFRNINSIEKLSNLLFPDSPTLDKVWDRIVQLYGNNPCFGTREIIKIYDNHKEDGKVFQKVKLGKYKWVTFNKVNDMVINLSKSIKFLNIPKKSNVIIFADTRAEWQITALACYKSGYTVVTIYPTLGKEAVKDAIIESDAPIIFTTSSHFDIIYDISNDIPNIKHIIYFEDRFYPTYKDPTKGEKLIYLKNKFVTCEYFDDFIYKREDYNDTIECTSTDDDVCLIMYTSGSVGKPKGVLLTHKNVIAAVVGMSNVVKATKKDTYIGYLPLAHILEICAEFIALSQGAKVGYSSAQTLIDTAAKIYPGTKGDTRELKPTILAAVPAVMDRIYKAVLDKVSNSGKISKEIFNICYERRLKRFEKGYSSLLIDRIIFKKIKNLLGGKVRLLISGGAPLSPTSQRFMNICFGCPVSQGYGLTETCGAAAITEGTDLSTGYVGAPLICNEIYLKECENTDYKPSNVPPQGEILIHGDNVCKGYYKNPKKTEEEFIIINGKRYFCTGDIGEIREDGSLKIIDRKKDLVKLSHGEYVSLGKVEANLITNKFVDTICVYANPNSSYVVALVVPNKNATIKLGNELSCKTDDWEELCKNKTLIDAFTNELMTFGKNKLEKFEIPKKIFLCHEPWTSANGLMTEALKLKRNVIEKRFKKEIDSMYA
uniref:long-chain-fatty-acid--CoA ligase n=1 Tax=Parastrongyloides trichosuri TaxID=131310 RepID=A0A0N4ZQ01_PARTI